MSNQTVIHRPARAWLCAAGTIHSAGGTAANSTPPETLAGFGFTGAYLAEDIHQLAVAAAQTSAGGCGAAPRRHRRAALRRRAAAGASARERAAGTVTCSMRFATAGAGCRRNSDWTAPVSAGSPSKVAPECSARCAHARALLAAEPAPRSCPLRRRRRAAGRRLPRNPLQRDQRCGVRGGRVAHRRSPPLARLSPDFERLLLGCPGEGRARSSPPIFPTARATIDGVLQRSRLRPGGDRPCHPDRRERDELADPAAALRHPGGTALPARSTDLGTRSRPIVFSCWKKHAQPARSRRECACCCSPTASDRAGARWCWKSHGRRSHEHSADRIHGKPRTGDRAATRSAPRAGSRARAGARAEWPASSCWKAAWRASRREIAPKWKSIVHSAASTAFRVTARGTAPHECGRHSASARVCATLPAAAPLRSSEHHLCVRRSRPDRSRKRRSPKRPGFVNAYEQSKWEAEQIVLASALPVEIARLSIVAGSERDGSVRRPGALHHTLYWLFKGLIPMMPGRARLAGRSHLHRVRRGSRCSARRARMPVPGRSRPRLLGDARAATLAELLEFLDALFARQHRGWASGAVARRTSSMPTTFALFEACGPPERRRALSARVRRRAIIPARPAASADARHLACSPDPSPDWRVAHRARLHVAARERLGPHPQDSRTRLMPALEPIISPPACAPRRSRRVCCTSSMKRFHAWTDAVALGRRSRPARRSLPLGCSTASRSSTSSRRSRNSPATPFPTSWS